MKSILSNSILVALHTHTHKVRDIKKFPTLPQREESGYFKENRPEISPQRSRQRSSWTIYSRTRVSILKLFISYFCRGYGAVTAPILPTSLIGNYHGYSVPDPPWYKGCQRHMSLSHYELVYELLDGKEPSSHLTRRKTHHLVWSRFLRRWNNLNVEWNVDCPIWKECGLPVGSRQSWRGQRNRLSQTVHRYLLPIVNFNNRIVGVLAGWLFMKLIDIHPGFLVLILVLVWLFVCLFAAKHSIVSKFGQQDGRGIYVK